MIDDYTHKKGIVYKNQFHNNQARKPTTLVVGRNHLNTSLKVNFLLNFTNKYNII